MNLQKKLRLIIFYVFLVFSLGHKVEAQTTSQTAIVFTNNTGVPDDAVYITLTGAPTTSGNTYGNGLSLSQDVTYSLAQLEGSVSGSDTNPSLANIPTIALDEFTGGRVYISLGVPGIPDTSTVSGYFEIYTNGIFTNNNIDTSYVNGVGLPIAFSVLNRADNSSVDLSPQLNSNSTDGAGMVGSLVGDPYTPASAISTSSYSAVNTNGQTVATISGTTFVSSPDSNPDYHDWSTPHGSNVALIPYLTGTAGGSNPTTATVLNVSSYQVPVGTPPLPGTLFGFSDVSYKAAQAYSPFNPDNSASSADPNNLFLKGQSYNMTATFKSDLNPTGDANLAGQGITQGTSGVVLTGTGSSVGSVTIYITNTELNKVTGLYGGNPQYTIMWTPTTGPDAGVTQYITQHGSNNLVDRIVGDLSAGANWGWAASTTTVAQQAAKTGTTAKLAGSIFDSTQPGNIANTPINQLSTGQYFYLLSLQGGNKGVAQWSGSAIDDNPLFYNTYSSDGASFTDSYTLSYSDRLQGNGSPDISYTPQGAESTVPLDQLYINVTLQPGSYIVTTPEPGTWAFLVLGLGFISAYSFLCRRKA